MKRPFRGVMFLILGILGLTGGASCLYGAVAPPGEVIRAMLGRCDARIRSWDRLREQEEGMTGNAEVPPAPFSPAGIACLSAGGPAIVIGAAGAGWFSPAWSREFSPLPGVGPVGKVKQRPVCIRPSERFHYRRCLAGEPAFPAGSCAAGIITPPPHPAFPMKGSPLRFRPIPSASCPDFLIIPSRGEMP